MNEPNRLARIRAHARGTVTTEGNEEPRKPEPRLTRELVEWLEECYPDRSPNPRDREIDVVIHASKVELVRALRAAYTAQQRSDAGPTTPA